MGAETQVGDDVGQPSSSADVSAKPRPDKVKKKRGFSRFLHSLRCCGAPENANSIDTDEPLVPPKKTSRVHALGAGSARAENKPDAHAAESSMAESKERMDEGLKDSEKTEIGSQNDSILRKETVVGRQEAGLSTEGIVPVNREGASNDAKPPEQNLPSQVAPIRTGEPELRNTESLQPPDVRVVVQAPTPVMSQAEELPSPTSTHPTMTTTVDNDVVMPDAPPPVQEEAVQEPLPEEDSPSPTAAVPPPPLPAGRVPDPPPAPAAADPSVDVAQAGESQQPWLLPPVPAHLRGRKCLVLDLDETLVHSSFKVRHFYFTFNITRVVLTAA